MSRGIGNLQRLLYQIIRDHRHQRPMTFAEIRMHLVEGGGEPWPALDRSARRALAGLAREGYVVAIGPGGVQRPHHYCVHPSSLEFMNDGLALQILSDFQREMRKAGTPACIESILTAIEAQNAKCTQRTLIT
jgi:hypothetical protein